MVGPGTFRFTQGLCDGATASLTLDVFDRLVQHGFLERRHDPRDRRANRVFLTASGRQLVDDLDSLRDSIASDVLQDIPVKAIETSLETLIDIKERIKGFAEPRGDIAAK